MISLLLSTDIPAFEVKQGLSLVYSIVDEGSDALFAFQLGGREAIRTFGVGFLLEHTLVEGFHVEGRADSTSYRKRRNVNLFQGNIILRHHFLTIRQACCRFGFSFYAFFTDSFYQMDGSLLIICFLNNNNQRQSLIGMPKHQGPIQRLIDPFSIPAQMNNLGVLIVAYVTKDMYDQSQCTDPEDVKFLNFIYYGSTIVCGGTFLMSLIYMIGLLDYCINKVMPCGEVCLTLNTLTIFLAGIAYHCVATVYGMLEMFWGSHSECVEIEMFKRITCTIYLIWFLCILAYLVFNIFLYNKKKQLQTVDQQYIQM